MYNRLATEEELDPYAADEEELRRIIAGTAPAPAPATDWTANVPTGWGGFTGEQKVNYFNQAGITPQQLAPYATPEEIQYFYDKMGYTVGKPAAAPAAPLTPYDVFKQNLFTTQMLPNVVSPETGQAEFTPGARSYQLGNQTIVPDDQGGYVVNTPTTQQGVYKAERFDASGRKVGEFINDARNTDLQDLAQFATTAIGAGPLAGMLGATAGSALGLGTLAPGAAATLGSGIASLGAGLITGQDPMTALQNAIKTGASAFLPGQISSFIPSTGVTALDTALKAATEAGVRTAVNGGDVESAVVGSLVNSGIGAVTGAAGVPSGLVNAAISIAKSGGDPQKIFNAVVSAAPAIQTLQDYYSKTDTGDETARLAARYGSADENVIRQIEAMSPRGTTAPGTMGDVQEAIFQDVLRQSPTQQVAPAGTEIVQQAIRDDLNRELADIVYLNADNAGIKTQQEAARVASQRGLPGFIFQGQTYKLSQAPGYLSPEGKLYPSEAAYVATLGPKTINIPGIQIESQGRTAPGVTAAQAAQLGQVPLRGEAAAAPAAPSAPFVNPAVDYTEAGTSIQGQPLPPGYEPTTTLSDIAQNLRDVRQSFKNVTDTGVRTGLSQLAGTGLRALELGGKGVGALFGTPEARQVVAPEEADALTAMQGAPLSPEAQVRDVQKELYDYQKEQFNALSNDSQKAAAAGIASAVNTIASYGLGGPWAAVANAAANTANISWMQGKEANLKPEDNAKRALFMGAIEAGGEALGVPFLKMLFKEVPMTGSKEALTDWLATKLKALGGEMFTEQLTSAGQLAVDKVASFGIPTDQTFQDAAISTGISTIFSFGGTGAAGTFTGTPGVRTVTTQAEPTPIEFLGSTPSTQIVPTEGLPQQLTYQPPAAPPSPVQITGPEAAPPAPEVFGPEAQLGFEEGVKPTAQQQIEEALSGVYEPPAPPPPAPAAPKDTSGITPEMVAFIDEEGNLVTYGDLGFTAPAPATQQAAPQAAPQTQPATEAMFAEPQMDEINRLFQEVYQQQNYPVATAPVAAPVTAAPAQQNVIDLASAPTVAAPAQNLSALQQAINQVVYGGTGEEPVTRAPVAPATGTILSTDPTQGTALVVDPNGNTKVVDVAPDSKPGDKVDITATPAQDLSTPIATDPTTGEVIRLGDVVPSAPSSAPAPSTTETRTQAPAPSQATITTAAPSPAPSTTETKTEAPAPAPTATETKTEAPAPAETKTEVKAPAPTITETKTEAPAPAEIKTEAPAPTTETKTEAPAPAPVTTEAKTEAPAPTTTEIKTEAPAPAPTATETKTEAPAPTTTETKTEAPAPAPPAQPPALPPSQPPAQPPAPPPARPPAPTPAPPPGKAPPPEGDLPPVTEEELREIVAGPPPVTAPPPPAPTPAPPAPTPAPPAPTPEVKPPAVKPPSPPPSPAAQLAKTLGIPEEMAQQILMQTEEADLLQLTTALKQEREEKREGLRGKLKSRKA